MNKCKCKKDNFFAKNLAVILIDMQEDFTRNIEKNELDIMMGNQLMILDICAKYHIPLIVLEYKGCGETLAILQEKIEGVATKQIIIKPSDDGFYDTSLSSQLEKWRIKNILLMGIYAGACVYQTAHSAIREDYNIITAKQLIADSSIWEVKLNWYIKNGTFCLDTQELLAKIAI